MPDISETLAPNSNQLDNIDLRGGPPRIFTVTKVDVRPGADQPVSVHLAEFDRPWKPGKNMRRVLAHCWGRESENWIGKRVELFADEKVKFGNDTPGGTRISRLSNIKGTQNAPILISQGKAGTYKVEPLPEPTNADRIANLRAEWKTAEPDRRKVIEAEVARLSGDEQIPGAGA
jgi:hypothetical protein